MIYALKVRDPKNTPVSHWAKVKWLKGVKKVEFKPGLNIIYGPNGSGKSTLLTALAILTHCWRSNWPKVNKDSLMPFLRPKGLANGMVLEHDGAPARYMSVDEPAFTPSGVSKTTLKTLKVTDDMRGKATHNMSHGQQSMAKLVRFLRAKPKGIRYVMTANKTTKDWRPIFMTGTAALRKKTKKKGFPRQQVVLLDEVDRSMDFTKQAAVWKELRKLAQTHQVIIASHSPCALNVPGAHYIETTPGYLEQSRRAIGLMVKAA